MGKVKINPVIPLEREVQELRRRYAELVERAGSRSEQYPADPDQKEYGTVESKFATVESKFAQKGPGCPVACAPASNVAPLAMALDRMGGSICELTEAIEALDRKLQPLLDPCVAPAGTPEEKCPQHSSVTNAILENSQRVRRLAEAVRQITGRIELN